jgi:hypothetical protein
MSLTNRPHLYLPIRDEKGDLLRYARVRIYLEDGKTEYAGRIYRDGTSTKLYSNPFVAAPALVNVYLGAPARIRLGVQADLGLPEVVGDVLDVTFDADQAVDTLSPLYVEGDWSVGGLLCGIDPDSAYWKPLRVDHEHETVAPNAVLAGPIVRGLRQAGTFPGSTVLGADAGGWGAASSLRNVSMLGSLADGEGRGGVAVGRAAYAAEGDNAPWTSASVAVGRDTHADTGGVTLGRNATATNSVAAGSWSYAPDTALAIGTDSHPATGGIAVGAGAGSNSRGMPGSIGLGAGAQYGLPSSTDPGDTSVLLGAHDPSRARVFPWANPGSSQSESPFDEYAPTMAFTGRTVQLQRHLEWLADITKLQVGGDATLGSPSGLLGFYGATPRAKPTLGDDEPSSGIPALDNLIYALRSLGLLRYRTEVSMLYRAGDLAGRYLDGDRVTDWPESFGTDTATAVPGLPPAYRASNTAFNGQPTVDFLNSVYRRSTRPAAEMRGSRPLPSERHFIAVANHEGPTMGLGEGLLNLAFLSGVISDDNQVLTAESYDSTRWDNRNVSYYARDGLNQTTNRDAAPPGPHVYAVSSPTSWPHAQPVIGGPRDTTNVSDRWSGQIAEVVGMDSTWEPAHVASMAGGLAFKYSINQPPGALREPSKSFLITQHDPMNGTLAFWNYDYSDAYTGKVSGRAIRVPKPVIFVPFISIYIAFSLSISFRGSLVGNWGNLAINLAFDYEVAISVKAGDLDGDGDMEIATDFDVHSETYIGIFSLNNNFTWSMGQLSSQYGYKVCRIRHRTTKVVVCISGDPPFRYADTDVKIYSTKSNGSLLLESTTPLWGDGTFKSWIKNPGKKIARIVERSTGNVLGTTEYQEKALPRTALYAADDPEVSFANRDKAYTYESALTALAILEMDQAYWYRARHILSTLKLVSNGTGVLNDSYSAVLPAPGAPAGAASARRWGAVWTILAVLRYQQVTGDGQFLIFARQLADNFLGSGEVPDTATAAVFYFALRDLATASGVSSYGDVAASFRTALTGSSYWIAAQGRFRESPSTDAESLWADVLGGLFLLAIRDRAKARQVIQHLKRFRVKGATVGAPHYTGPAGLIGYKPFADLGDLLPHLAPPAVIDQAGTWAAVLFKLRYGEPAGDDVQALYRWQQTVISADPAGNLYAAQFLRYSANATTGGYALRARPHLASAAWGHLLAAGARALFAPDPLGSPTVVNPGLVSSTDAATGRLSLRITWQAGTAVPAVAYEAIVEQSVNGGTSWSAAAQGSLSGSLASVASPDSFAVAWATVVPENPSTLFRVRIRLRNAAFGAWSATPSVGLPPTA